MEDENFIYVILTNEAINIDEICAQLKRYIPEVVSILCSLEIKNIVIQLPGKLFNRV